MRMSSTRTFHFLPEDILAMFGRRLAEIGGLAVISVAAATAVALATWSVQDPSFNHATDAAVKNWLGRPGAIAADFLMQSVGLAAVAVVLPAAVWGWQIVTHRPASRLKFRLAGWILGVVLCAGFVAALPTSPSWPLPAGLGGVLGDALMRLPAFVVGDAFMSEIKLFVGLFYGGFRSARVGCGMRLGRARETGAGGGSRSTRPNCNRHRRARARVPCAEGPLFGPPRRTACIALCNSARNVRPRS